MIEEKKYLKSVEHFVEIGMDKEKIINGIEADYKNKKISLEIYVEAKKLCIKLKKPKVNIIEVADKEEIKRNIFMM